MRSSSRVPALWWRRAIAVLIDLAIQLTFMVLVGFIIGLIVGQFWTPAELHSKHFGQLTLAQTVLGIGALIALIILTLTYGPLLSRRRGERNGQTIGKQLLKIRVVRDDGQPVAFKFALLREGGAKTLEYLLLFIPFIGWIGFLVCFLWPLRDPRSRAIHDLAVHSEVVDA